MNKEELQKWYAALEEADRRAQAGDEQASQDAAEIANTIRQLESGQGYRAQLEEPMVWGAVGAAPATAKMLVGGARSIFAPPPAALQTASVAPKTVSSPTSPVKVFNMDTSGRAAETTHNVRTAEISEESKRAKQIMDALYKKNIIPSTSIPGIAGSTEAGVVLTSRGLQQANEPPPRPPFTQRTMQGIKNIPAATGQALKAAPHTAVNIGSNLPGRGVVAGFSSGALLADASNYRELAKEAAARGDEKAAAYYNGMAAASLTGSGVAGVSSLAPRTSPKTRFAAIPAAGLALYNFLQSQSGGYPAPGEQPVEEKAAGGLAHMAKGKSVAEAAKKFIFPAAEKAGETQIPGTIPTYRKANKILTDLGAEGLGMDYGAGLGKGVKVMSGDFQTFEPFHKNKWVPDFTRPEDIPSDAYGRLVNLNVLNVLNPETRAEAVKHIGRVMEPGGSGIITTRGMDVLRTKRGTPGPEDASFITGKGTYQKGFTPSELEDYLKYMLGEGYDIRRLGLGPAGALIHKKAEGGLANMAGGGHATPAWQRKEGQNPEGGLNAAGRASYHRETGGTLKRPQPEGGARRDSFCARMKGAKKKLTSAETANDPDSRINKSLRAWNC